MTARILMTEKRPANRDASTTIYLEPQIRLGLPLR